MGTMMKKILLMAVFITLPAFGQALTASVPHSFSSGSAISASQMVANFTSLTTFLNASVCKSDGTNCPGVSGCENSSLQ